MTVNPEEFENQCIPLWAVLDGSRIECVMVNQPRGVVTVWGYSVWRRSPGFRTLGLSLDSYRRRAGGVEFYADHEQALSAVKLATTPSKKLAKTMLTDKQRELMRRDAFYRDDI